MSSSPYPIVSLNDLAEKVDYGLTASATDAGNGPKFLRITDIQDDRVDWATVPLCNCEKEDLDKYALAEGDIVFARTGATTGKSFLIRSCPPGAVFASYLIRVRPSVKVDSGYLARFFQTPNYWHQIDKSSTGTAQAGVNASNLKKLAVPLPSIAEQRRIAAILDRADAVRRKRQKAIALTEELLRSAFLEMFGDPVANPKHWEVVELGTVTESKLGKMLWKEASTGLNPVPYLGNSHVRWRSFNLSDLPEMDFSESELEKLDLRNGDLLVCEGGEVGRCAIWRNQIQRISFQKALHRVRCNVSKVLPEYLQEYFFLMAKQGGLNSSTSVATIAHLTGVKLKQLPLPLPPIDMQYRFQKFYKLYEDSIEKYDKTLKEQENLFNSLLQRAFRGEL